MKMNLSVRDLELAHPFTISRATIHHQPTLIVSLTLDGKTGYGEATSNQYYEVTTEGMSGILEGLRPIIESHPFTTPEELYRITYPFLRKFPFAQCALDCAAHDLYGRLQQQPLWQMWGGSDANLPLSSYTIGIDTIPKMIEKMQEKPWPIYKVKLGRENDLDMIKALRKHTSAVIRVDANCAWDWATTVENSAALRALGVEFIEQPMPRESGVRNLRRAFTKSALPLVADESCQREDDVETCAGKFHAINIKLVKCGGLTPALRMIKMARELNLDLMIGCMTESSVGISAVAQLLPFVDYADVDGAILLKQDIARGGIKLEDGKVKLNERPGIGVELLP